MRYKVARLCGAKIRDARKRAGWTQARLAHAVVVTVAVVTRWENGSHAPTMENLVRVGQALRIEPGTLVPMLSEMEG